MRDVLSYIRRRTTDARRNPLISWISDESVPARERLSAWLPCAVPFVFGFMDLNAIVLRYPDEEAAGDRRKRAINRHLDEDATHWPYFLADLRILGLDEPSDLHDLSRFLWGDDTKMQRVAVYEICRLSVGAEDPVLRYSLLSAMESHAHLLFSRCLDVGEVLRRDTGIELQYFGPRHVDREPGHLANQQDTTEAELEDVSLDRRTRAEAQRIAGAVCDLIEARWREEWRFVEGGRHRAFMSDHDAKGARVASPPAELGR